MDDIIEFDANEIVNTKAIEILQEIQNIIQSDKDDFEMIEEIVCVFEQNGLNAGVCHDFGWFWYIVKYTKKQGSVPLK